MKPKQPSSRKSPAWTGERLKALLMLLNQLLDHDVKLRLRVEFFPATESQKAAIKEGMERFIEWFPDPDNPT
jgi:hypothetical protein